MIFPTIHELTLITVADRNVPNQERIVLRPTQSVNLAKFGVFLGHRLPNGLVRPHPDYFFWFGEVLVAPPSWVFIYTGSGNFQLSKMPNTGEEAYVFHWGKAFTILGQTETVPFLFRFDSIIVPPERLK